MRADMQDATSDHSVWAGRAAPRARRERGGRLGQLWAPLCGFLAGLGVLMVVVVGQVVDRAAGNADLTVPALEGRYCELTAPGDGHRPPTPGVTSSSAVPP